MHAFISADRNGTGDRCQRLVAAGGKRLLDQVDPFLGADRKVIGKRFGRPALVGVEDDAAFRCAGAHRTDAGSIIRRADLDLEERAVGIFGGLLAHRVGLGKRKRIGRGQCFR
ncbi:hypothetical protein D9M68_921540 [compost metagenome]